MLIVSVVFYTQNTQSTLWLFTSIAQSYLAEPLQTVLFSFVSTYLAGTLLNIVKDAIHILNALSMGVSRGGQGLMPPVRYAKFLPYCAQRKTVKCSTGNGDTLMLPWAPRDNCVMLQICRINVPEINYAFHLSSSHNINNFLHDITYRYYYGH